MSIKIYEAYRLPLSRIHEAINLAHEIQIKAAYSHFKRYADASFKKHKDEPTKQVVDLFVKQIEQCEAHSITCGFHVYVNPVHQFAYFIPYGYPLSESVPSWFEDFSYWDNTDPPDGIALEDFKDRGKELESIGVFNEALTLSHETIGGTRGVYALERRWVDEVWIPEMTSGDFC